MFRGVWPILQVRYQIARPRVRAARLKVRRVVGHDNPESLQVKALHHMGLEMRETFRASRMGRMVPLDLGNALFDLEKLPAVTNPT